eukprot:scaffold51068_cov22-Tisochrysis_lutea.AAC.1
MQDDATMYRLDACRYPPPAMSGLRKGMSAAHRHAYVTHTHVPSPAGTALQDLPQRPGRQRGRAVAGEAQREAGRWEDTWAEEGLKGARVEGLHTVQRKPLDLLLSAHHTSCKLDTLCQLQVASMTQPGLSLSTQLVQGCP